jgi:hypothetical protein
MFNKSLYSKLEEKYGPEKMVQFSEMVSEMYDILHKDTVKNEHIELSEYDFERDWWSDKHKQLIQE